MKVAVLGFGNVASATIESFMANHEIIRAKTRTLIQFVHVATRTPARAEGCVPEGCAVSSDCWGLVADPQVDVVLELTGDVPLGRQLVLRALSNRKHVITANKALLATHGEEIMALADEVGCCVMFEGAVAVSIPIIKTLRESAAANRISSVIGILNGTSNYVLSQMSEHGADFADALAEAQRQGYAEADPTLDVNGEDAAQKLTLLASLSFGVPIQRAAVQVEGIQGINALDIGYARRLGYQIKLIAQGVREPEGLNVGVRPMLVPMTSMLAQVSGSMNGIALKGDLMGSAFLYGSGAGGKQTSSAVLADLIELANRDGKSKRGPYNMGFRHAPWKAEVARYTRNRNEPLYIRLRHAARLGMLARVRAFLAQVNVHATELLHDEGKNDIVVITHRTDVGRFQKMLPALSEAAGAGHSVAIYPVLEPH